MRNASSHQVQPGNRRNFKLGVLLSLFAVVPLTLALLGALGSESLWSSIDPGAIAVETHFNDNQRETDTAEPLTWWLTRDYLTRTPPPDVVIFGSSQIGGLRSADARAAGKKLDITIDHQSYLLEKLLQEQTGKQHSVFVAQHPGTLVADFLVMSETWFSVANKQPKIVVITLTARDFLSDSRPYIGSGAAFRCLSKYVDLDDLTWIVYPNTQSRLNWLLAQRVAPRMFPSDSSQRNGPNTPDSQVSNGNSTTNGGAEFRLSRGRVFFEDVDRQDYLPMEYPQKAYEKPDLNFNSEMLCFLRLLEFLEQKQIKVFVIGTPLYAPDRAEVDKQCWSRFSPRISQACKQHNARFLDLTDSNEFLKDDFLDPVHLGIKGGTKLAIEIAKLISMRN